MPGRLSRFFFIHSLQYFKYVFIVAHHDEMILFFKIVVRMHNKIRFFSLFDAQYINMVFRPDIHFPQRPSHPVCQGQNFIDGTFPAQFNIVKHMAGAAAVGQPFRNITVRIYNLIGPVPQKKFCLYIPYRLADYIFGAHLLQQTGNLKTALKIFSDADKTVIKIVHAQCFQHIHLGAVSYFRAGDNGKHLFQRLLLLINRQYLIAQLRQFSAEMITKFPHSNDQYRFHIPIPFFPYVPAGPLRFDPYSIYPTVILPRGYCTGSVFFFCINDRAKVMLPILPQYIRKIITHLETADRSLVIPHVIPTVPMAEQISNITLSMDNSG